MGSTHEFGGLLQSLMTFLQDRIHRPDLYFGFSDAQLTAVVPVSSYWLSATFYELLDYFDLFPEYRLQPTEEERRRNVPSKSHVIKTVLTLHVCQLILGLAMDFLEVGSAGDETSAWWADLIWSYFPPRQPSTHLSGNRLQQIIPTIIHASFLLGRQLLALAVIDTWVFWFHFTAHKVQWIYRKRISHLVKL